MTRQQALHILGLSEGFTVEVLTKAWRAAAMRTHPDLGGNVTDFKNVKIAYEVLKQLRGADLTRSFTFKPVNIMTEETKFKNAIKTHLTGLGAKVFKVHGSEWQEPGWPDLYVAHKTWTGWLELKVSASDAALQKRRIEELKIRGVFAAFARKTGNKICVYDCLGLESEILLPMNNMLESLKWMFMNK